MRSLSQFDNFIVLVFASIIITEKENKFDLFFLVCKQQNHQVRKQDNKHHTIMNTLFNSPINDSITSNNLIKCSMNNKKVKFINYAAKKYNKINWSTNNSPAIQEIYHYI